MIDAFYIFTKGGLLLWSTQLVKVKGDPLDRLIKEVLLEERVGETFANLQSYSLKWKLLNELDLFFVVVYQGIKTMEYLEELLSDCSKAFLHQLNDLGGLKGLKPPYGIEFDGSFKKVLAKADRGARENRRSVSMKSFDQTDKGKKVLKDQEDKGIDRPSKKKSSKDKGEGDSEDEEGSDHAGNSSGGDADAGAQEEAGKKGKAKAKSGPGKFVPKEKKGKKDDDAEDDSTAKKKSGKEARAWDTNGKVTKSLMNSLDHSKKEAGGDGDEADDAEFIRKQKEIYLEGSDDEPLSDGEASSLASDDEEEAKQEQEKKQAGLFGKLTRSVKNITGGAVLGEEDLAPILKNFKTSLMAKNVAADVAEKLADSVRTSLIGKRTDRFTSMSATVKGVLQDAIETQLTPKKSIDVLRAALAAKNAGRVYTVVFLGVNGVGKSTNLAKVAYYLKHKGGLNVLICACDTFRAGAVEQLKTHSRCLDVPLFERGYGKDPADIAKHAIAHAQSNGHDVVLVDTAGRMQDNEPLMRALAKLVAVNSPDLVLFVGEALVGNDAIDQVTKFNRSLVDMSHDPRNPRGIDGMLLTKYDTVDDKVGAALSMVYATGQPIVFVGCGQKYTHLRKLSAKDVAKALLR